jgi:hypothetical protein
VHDLHLGIVTSSMGGGGATDICDPLAKISPQEAPNCTSINRHNDDKAHLIDRSKPDCTMPNGVEGTVSDATPANYLAWLPDVPKNDGKSPPSGGVPAIKDRAQLVKDFASLVSGAQEFGCGLESQMESWYRFLVQPDPWDSIQLDTSQSPAAAQLVGVDSVILQQRHDFLRSDSLLAVIVVTDEEDSWSDPMWLGGRGWLTRAQNNTYSTTGQLPRGTTACSAPVDANNPTTTGPNDPACQWCAFNGTQNDPNCAVNKGLYGPKEDGLNVRYTNDMKRRYGMNPQFPVQRYVDGLRRALVPDRQGEHFTTDNKFSSTYLGRKTCRNPIYADTLPTDPNGELCNLKPGQRTSDLVFFGLIGGVPWQLLTENAGKPPTDPGYTTAKFKEALSDQDWVRILGKDPATYQDEGIDPHMIESIKPRAGLPCQGSAPPTCDPFNGKEWDTTSSKVGIDLQYACTFTLPKPKDCTKLPEGATCDCGMNYSGPLCDPNSNDGGNLTLQTRGKAYPTIRELRVAKQMGDNGVVASICPRSLDTNNPDYGYRPAVRAIVDRLKAVLEGQCLPQPLTRNGAGGPVPCLILVVVPGMGIDQTTACGPRGSPDTHGLQQPDQAVLESFNAQRIRDLQVQLGASVDDGGGAPTITANDLPPVCELTQIVPDPGSCPGCTFLSGKVSCADTNTPGWCYVEGAAAGQCPLGSAQSIKFGLPPTGQTYIQCIQQTGGGQ